MAAKCVCWLQRRRLIGAADESDAVLSFFCSRHRKVGGTMKPMEVSLPSIGLWAGGGPRSGELKVGGCKVDSGTATRTQKHLHRLNLTAIFIFITFQVQFATIVKTIRPFSSISHGSS